MRRPIIAVLAAVALSSSALAAKPPRPGPLSCPKSGGQSKDPFYSVAASQNVMPGPIHKPRPIGVNGQYRLDMRSGKLTLVEARPQGINPDILLLNLRMIPDPRAGGHCLTFTGKFSSRPASKAQITDWRGHTITVPIVRLQ